VRARLRLAALLSALLSVGGAHGEEQLTLPAPGGWRTVTAIETAQLRMSAFAVPGESPEAPDKLSFEWFTHGLADGVDPFDLVEQVAGTIRGNCRGGSDQGVFAGEENGYPTVVRLLLCPQLNGTDPPRGELLMMKVVKGTTGFWIIVRGRDLSAERAPDPDTLRATVRAWSEGMRAITLCDPTAPDHPCPATESDGPAP
jgi:hypothetical protein